MIAVPAVGSIVKVTTKWRNAYIDGPEFQFYQHEGRVIKPDVWMKKDEFNVETGNPKYPVSTFKLRNVENIEYIGETKPVELRSFKITSKKSGKEYIVTVGDNEYQCTCPGWNFRGTCKHAVAVMKLVNKN
jgi:hypothetical protein